jgi:hypothetical protein
LGWSQNGEIRSSTGSQQIRQGDRVHSAALVCLISVFAQFFLPIAHTAWHIAEDIPLITGVVCSCSGWGHNAATLKLRSTAEERPHFPHHDPSTCSICETLQHSSNFTFEHYSPVSSALTFVRLLSSDYSGTSASDCHLSGGGPRAPPLLV